MSVYSISGQLPTNIIWSNNNSPFIVNNTWTGYTDFTGYGFSGYTGDAGFTFNNYGGIGNSYNLKYGVNVNPLPVGKTGYYRNTISLKGLAKNKVIPYQKVESNDQAWVAYETSNGSGIDQNSTNVFSYAFEIIKHVGFSLPLIDSGTNTSGYVSYVSGIPAQIITFTGNLLSELSSLSKGGCDYADCGPTTPQSHPWCNFDPFGNGIKMCWTGNDITGSEYESFLKFIINNHSSGFEWAGLVNSPTGAGLTKYDPLAILENPVGASGAPITSGMFNYITGNIIFDNFVLGDSISFQLYDFDYTGLYRAYHNSYPLYPQTGFTLNCPQDFTGAGDLTNVLNQRLNSPMSYPVWYPYANLSGTPVGVYMTGSLMSFSLSPAKTGTTLTTTPNIIHFISNRNYTSGFQLKSAFNPPPQVLPVDNGQYQANLTRFSGYSYLLPNAVELQGYDPVSGKWVVLDRQEHLYNQLTGLKPTVFTYTGYNAWLNTGTALYYPPPDSGNVTGSGDAHSAKQTYLENSGEFVEAFFSGQTAYAQRFPYICPVISHTRPITIIWPSGFPSGMLETSGQLACTPKSGTPAAGFDPCQQWLYEQNITGLKLVADFNLEDELLANWCFVGTVIPYVKVNDTTCYACTGSAVAPTSGFSGVITSGLYYRTGWNLNPTGTYLSYLLSQTNPPYDITQLSFSKYRLAFTGFAGGNIVDQSDLYLKPLSSFMFRNINLFSAQNDPLSARLVTGDTSSGLFGSFYTLQPQGTILYPFTTNYNYNIPDQSYSGMYTAYNEGIYYTPTGDEVYAKFWTSSGRIIGDVTGILSGTFTGSGIVSNTFNDNYYFYNPNTNQVTFDYTVSDYATSAGKVLSGEAIILNQKAISKSIIIGGVLSNQSYFAQFTSGNNYISGGLVGIPYQEDNVLGVYILTGAVTGISQSGYLNYNFPATGQYDGNVNNIPYYYKPTGFINASAIVPINFTALRNYDYLEINSNAISYYSTQNSNYFSDISGLLNTINSQPLVYQVSGLDLSDPSFYGQYSGTTGIILYSLLSGTSGNNITISSDTTSGIRVPSGGYLTGGQDLYSVMFNTDLFSGTAAGTLYQTGLYSSILPTGTVFGSIPTYQFTRNFTDVWAISTGLPKNLVKYNTGSNLVAPGHYFSTISGDLDIGRYDNLLKIVLNYYNIFGMPTGVGSDVIDLYATGYNFPSGTGIMFRITGIK